MTWLPLLIFLLLKLGITRWTVSDRFLAADLYGHATKPLVITVKSEGCPLIGVLVDGPEIRRSTFEPREGLTSRAEFPRLASGAYGVVLGCLAANEQVISTVQAGEVTVQ